MSIFDNRGNDAQGLQKAVELSEIVRLNAQISDEEKQLSEVYERVGRLFVLEGQEEEELHRLATDAVNRESRLADYRLRLRELKGVRICPRCGAESFGNVPFCGACGASMAESPSDTVRCPNCGAMVKNQRFCVACGNRLQQDQPEFTPVPEYREPVESPVEEVSITSSEPDLPPEPVEPVYAEPYVEQVMPEPIPEVLPVSETVPEAAEMPEMNLPDLSMPAPEPAPEAAPEIPEVPEMEPAQPAAAPDEDCKYCTQCGAKLPSYSIFCTECGARL